MEFCTRYLDHVLRIREALSTEHGESVCFLSSCISPYRSLRVSSIPLQILSCPVLSFFFAVRNSVVVFAFILALCNTIPFRKYFLTSYRTHESFPLHSLSVVIAFTQSDPNQIHSSLAIRNNSGELAKIRRCIRRTHSCRRLDGIDTPGLGCPWYICPQTISDILFGWILPGCPGGPRQPKHYSVRLLSQIHAGKRKGKSGLRLSGISSLFGPNLYDVAPGAFQKRCRDISHGQCPKRR